MLGKGVLQSLYIPSLPLPLLKFCHLSQCQQFHDCIHAPGMSGHHTMLGVIRRISATQKILFVLAVDIFILKILFLEMATLLTEIIVKTLQIITHILSKVSKLAKNITWSRCFEICFDFGQLTV